MGASTFYTRASGKTAKEAFQAARDNAFWERGHGGYTGTIAEKTSFVEIPVADCIDPYKHAQWLVKECDPRIDDKWGPAGCIRLPDNEWLFFGWASC